MKNIVCQKYPLRKAIVIISTLVLLAIGIFVFYYNGAFKANASQFFAVYAVLFVFFLLLYYRVICPEMTLHLPGIVYSIQYETETEKLSIYFKNASLVLNSIDSIVVRRPYYSLSSTPWGIIPKREMMDGKISIYGEGKAYTIWFCDDIKTESTSFDTVLSDILSSFKTLELKKCSNNGRVMKYSSR